MSTSARIGSRLFELGIAATDGECISLAAYIGLLTKWSHAVNLTSLQLEPLSDSAIDRLIAEPMAAAAIARHLTPPISKLLDIGSGGGSPAIPLKVAMPAVSLVMLESRDRKSAFLREAVRILDLSSCDVLTARLEDLVEPGVTNTSSSLKDQPDAVSVRAVRADVGFWEAVASILAPGGRVLWFRNVADQGEAGAPSGFEVEANQELVAGTLSQLVILRPRAQQ